MNNLRDSMSEAELQEGILAAATFAGWHTYHTYDSRRSNAGFPDLVLVHPDRGLVIAELKSATGKVSPAQQEWLTQLARWNPHVYLWRPCNYDPVVDWLTASREVDMETQGRISALDPSRSSPSEPSPSPPPAQAARSASRRRRPAH